MSMSVLSSLYDARNERYPIYHSGVLAFVITTCLPLNLGISKLPVIDVFLLLSAGFLSLFMLARNEYVGQGLLAHLMIGKQAKSAQKQHANLMVKRVGARSNEYKKHDNDPFSLLQNIVEQIIITHDEQMDLETRVRLEAMQTSLQKKTHKLCSIQYQ